MSTYFLHNQLGIRSGDIYNSIFWFAHEEEENGQKKREKKEIQIQLKNDSIEFFFTVDDIKHRVNVRRHIHLFSLPTDTPERTDYFLLNTSDINIKICTSDNKTRLYYISDLPENKLFEVNRDDNLINIYEILLCLFDELYNPESDINKYSPVISDSIIGRLNRSSVFSLIRKKFNFYKALHNWNESIKNLDLSKVETDSDEYIRIKKNLGFSKVKTAFNEFLDSILNDSLGRTIPISKFDGVNWFQNQEQELENLRRINSEYRITENPLKNIQNYFLKKHALLSALKVNFGNEKTNTNKGQTSSEIQKSSTTKDQLIFGKLNINNLLYYLIIVFQLIAFMSFFILFVLWLNTSYESTNLLMGVGIISFLISIVLLFISQQRNKTKNFNLVMPRIFIAMTLVLYGINGSEAILKNQFLVDSSTVVIAIICGLIILTLSINLECRQHSPYYRPWKKKLYNYKILPILIYAFNGATMLVLFSQVIISHTFIDNTNIYSTHIFSEELDSLKKMRDQYKVYNEEIEKVQGQNCYTLFLILGQNVSNYRDTIDIESSKKLIARSKDLHLNENEINQSLQFYDVFKRDVRVSKELRADMKIRNLNAAFLLSDIVEKADPIQIDFSNKYLKEKGINHLIKEFNCLKNIAGQTDSILHLLSKRYVSLSTQAKIEPLLTFPPKKNLQNLHKNDPDYGLIFNNNRVYVVNLFSSGNKIYPNMFMLQVIIIMLVGLVGQLFVSGKTVTEPI